MPDELAPQSSAPVADAPEVAAVPEDQPVPTKEDAPTTEQVSTPDPVAQLQTDLGALATETGFSAEDLSSFSSVEDARAAIANYYRNQKPPTAGAPPAPVQPQQPAFPQTAPAAPAAQGGLNLADIGLDDDEPAAKAIRALESQLNGSREEMKAVAHVVKSLMDSQDQAREYAATQREQEAQNIVDSFASPRYGTGAHRNAFQEEAVRRLYDTANGIAIQAYNQGRPIPGLRARLEIAHKLDNPQASQAGGTAPAPALPEVAQAAAPSEGVSFFESWRDNPVMLNVAKAAMSR